MYLSFSGDDTYRTCPRDYYHKYIARTPLVKPDNRVNMLYGDTVGKIFECFYAQRLWRGSEPVAELQALVIPTLKRVMANEIRKGGVFDWSDKTLKEGSRSLEEIEGEVRETLPRGLRAIKHHRLMGHDVQCEMNLEVLLGGHKIGGRADFVLTRVAPHGDLVIVDGKGSRYRDQYVNHRQLRWYAMQHRLKLGKAPDKLGFLFWRSPPETSMDWSVVTPEALDALQVAVVATATEITDAESAIAKGENPLKMFPATPGPDCKRCSYFDQCPEGKQAHSKAAKAEMKADLLRGVEDGEITF